MWRHRTIGTGALAAGLLVGSLLVGAGSPTWAATTTSTGSTTSTSTGSTTSTLACAGTAAVLTAVPQPMLVGRRVPSSARVLIADTDGGATCGSPYTGPVTLVLTVGSHAQSEPPMATVVLTVPPAQDGVVLGDPVVPAGTPTGPGLLTLSWPNGGTGGEPVSIPVDLARVVLPPAPPTPAAPHFTG